jgi:acyl carrier protein phosphodiesterase
MNYLAHAYLSGTDVDLLIGNFVADHVKGSAIQRFPEKVREGIILHRMIDSFTDTHPVVEECKAALRPRFRKYAPVITDLYFDHFLARDWKLFHHQELPVFAQGCYSHFRKNEQWLPERTVFMLGYMEKQDWLTAYATIDGIGMALKGMARRARFESGMEHAQEFLEENYELFDSGFKRYFPDLRNHVEMQIIKTAQQFS